MNLITACVLQALQELLECNFNHSYLCIEALFELQAVIRGRWSSVLRLYTLLCCRWKSISDLTSVGQWDKFQVLFHQKLWTFLCIRQFVSSVCILQATNGMV